MNVIFFIYEQYHTSTRDQLTYNTVDSRPAMDVSFEKKAAYRTWVFAMRCETLTYKSTRRSETDETERENNEGERHGEKKIKEGRIQGCKD